MQGFSAENLLDFENENLNKTKKVAYVTLFSNDAYLHGVLALCRSLKLVHSRYPLLVLHTASVSLSATRCLEVEGCTLLPSTPLDLPDHVDHSLYARQLYKECWCKLRMWELEDFDRLIYLDADMAVFKNIDHLFNLPRGFYAVGDCFGGREEMEVRNSCCYFHPDEQPGYFNAGFMVLNPSTNELRVMMSALKSGALHVGKFAEQDMLNSYFKGQWQALGYTYNAQKRIKTHHPNLWDLNDIHILHYVDEKPWSHRYAKENKEYGEEVERWWHVFEGNSALHYY